MGLEDFASDSSILASSHQPTFLNPENRRRNSLCERLGLDVPEYSPILVDHKSLVSFNGITTGLQVLHTPGHTPDELALWDEEDHMLYVGDTVYEHSPIIFPLEGDITVWMASMLLLIELVESKQAVDSPVLRTRINAGHDTSMGDALDVLSQGLKFVENVVAGREPAKKVTMVDGVKVIFCSREDRRFSLRCPEELVVRAREHMSV